MGVLRCADYRQTQRSIFSADINNQQEITVKNGI